MEYYILNDTELSFKDILKRHLCGEPLVDKKEEKEKESEKEVKEKKKSPAKRSRKSDSKKEKEEEKAKDDDEDEDKEKSKDEEKMEVDEDKEDKEAKKEAKKEDEDEKTMPAPTMTPERRKISVSIQPPQISLQQMEQVINQYEIRLAIWNRLMLPTLHQQLKFTDDLKWFEIAKRQRSQPVLTFDKKVLLVK